MGTRCAIGYETADGRIRAKYSHWDGYPAYTGKVLEEHYQDEQKIREMVELGSQSVIEPEIYPKGDHDFESPEDNVTVFYGRDRGEEGCEAREFAGPAEMEEHYRNSWIEFLYVRMNGVWMVRPVDSAYPWQAVGDVLEQELDSETV